MSSTYLFIIVLLCRCIAEMERGDETDADRLNAVSFDTVSDVWTEDAIINDDTKASWTVSALNAKVSLIANKRWHGPYSEDSTSITRKFYCPKPSEVSISFSGIVCGTQSYDDYIKFYFNEEPKKILRASEATDPVDISLSTVSTEIKCTYWHYLPQRAVYHLDVPDASTPFEIKFMTYFRSTYSNNTPWLAVRLNSIACHPYTTTTATPETTAHVHSTQPDAVTTTTEEPDSETTTTEEPDSETTTSTTTTTTKLTTRKNTHYSTLSTFSTLITVSGSTLTKTSKSSTTATSSSTTSSTEGQGSSTTTTSTTESTTTTTAKPTTTTSTTKATESSTTSTTSTTQNNNEGEVQEARTTAADSEEVKTGQNSGRSQEFATGINGLTKGPNLIFLMIGAAVFVIVCVVIFVYCRVQRNKSIAKDIQFNIKKDIEADMDNVPKESASSKDMHAVAPPVPNAPVQLQMDVGTFSNPSYPNMAMSLQSNPEIFNDALGNLNAVNDVLMNDVINDMEKKPTAGDDDMEEGDYVTKGGDDEEEIVDHNAEPVGEGDAYGEDIIAGPETTGGLRVDNDDDDEYVPVPPKPPSDGMALPQVTGGIYLATPGWNAEDDDDENVAAPPPVPPVPDGDKMYDEEEEDVMAAPETTGGGTRGYYEQNGEDDDAPPAPPAPPV